MASGDEFLFHILHVEDEDFAFENEDDQYEGDMKDLVEECLSSYSDDSRIQWDNSLISWRVASNQAQALKLLQEANRSRPGRGFDAVLCDLKIPKDGSPGADWKHGLAIVEAVNRYGWPGALIVVSHFAEDEEILRRKEVLRIPSEQGSVTGRSPVKPNGTAGPIRVDEWINKKWLPSRELIVSKLRRCLVPLRQYIRLCERLSPPALFINNKMRRLLRDLVIIARQACPDWPLAKVLLVGDPGAGKGMISRVFHALLPETGRPDLQEVNCASLVASAGHGGLMRLFGTHTFQLVLDSPGIFERATCYRAGNNTYRAGTDDNAGLNGEPIAARAGVAFLDEFTELHPYLQASVLKAIEDGIVHREGDGQPVRFRCHIIFATNRPITKLTADPVLSSRKQRTLRTDLVDRIPHILRVPSLKERLDEIEPLIKAYGAWRLDPNWAAEHREPPFVEISRAALLMIHRAIEADPPLINSFRQIQQIADLQPGENIITDGNVAALLEKATLLGKREKLTRHSADMSYGEQCKHLFKNARLAEEFSRGDVPENTKTAIKELLQRQWDNKARVSARHIWAEEDIQVRFSLLSYFVDNSLYDKPENMPETRRRVAKKLGLSSGGRNKGPGGRTGLRQSVKRFLLGK